MGLREGRTASRALGYPQVIAMIDGVMSQPEAHEAIVLATRRYARRQQRWFGRDPRTRWLDGGAPTLSTAGRILALLAGRSAYACPMTGRPIPFAKGHGTGNDFVILPNLDAMIEVTPALVAALCDRRRGVGADGVLVVARTASHPEVADQADVAPYFMDYRNADGSTAQMCGNGARVFVAHLLESGLAGAGRLQIATRGGTRAVQVAAAGGPIRVHMGTPEFLDRQDIEVRVAGLADSQRARSAVGVLVPNPHAVTWVEDVAEAGDLRDAPIVSPAQAFPEGTNVEFVQVIAADRIAMRVFERGVGETLSCGTGACAAAVASLRRAGHEPAGQTVTVQVPGGVVSVTWRVDGGIELEGPAEIVARGTIDPGWWARNE